MVNGTDKAPAWASAHPSYPALKSDPEALKGAGWEIAGLQKKLRSGNDPLYALSSRVSQHGRANTTGLPLSSHTPYIHRLQGDTKTTHSSSFLHFPHFLL